jgi:aromatic-L-amino-acid/L-tryptophan decarboxylase
MNSSGSMKPNLYIYSFRFAPVEDRELAQRSERDRERVDAKLDRLNQRIADEIQARGIAFIMTTRIRERTVLRMSICSHRTTLADIDAVFDALTRIGLEISEEEDEL